MAVGILSYTATQIAASWVNLITLTVATLSCLGCLFNIVATSCLDKHKVIFGKMIIILAVFDIFNVLPLAFNTISSTSDGFTCEIIGSGVNFFGYGCSVLFTTCFAHSLYHSFKNRNICEQYLTKYVLLSVIWGLILGTSSVILQFMEYIEYPDGQSACTPRQKKGLNWSTPLFLVLPEFISAGVCTYYYVELIRVYRTFTGTVNKLFVVYPLILIVCISPAIVRRVLILFQVDIQSGLILYISRGLFLSQGLLNSLAYGLFGEIKGLFTRRCRRSETPELLARPYSHSELSEHVADSFDAPEFDSKI